MKRFLGLILAFVVLSSVQGQEYALVQQIDGCTIFPDDNIWNTPIDNLPVDPNSALYIQTIGADRSLKADFGSGIWPPDTGGPIGIPYIVVPGTQPKVNVTFEYDDESDPGPYPIPPGAPIEGGPSGDGDRHVLVVDKDNCVLYETFSSYPQADGSWTAGSGAIYDLNSNALRPDGWTSADAAGLPILPGLVRYDEVASGEITHALRFTVPQTRNTYVWPARHYASSRTGVEYPPMGQYFRLKADYDISGFSPQTQVILRALKKYGMILADNGSAWYMSGVPDERWDNDLLRELQQIKGSDLEAVDVSSLIVDPNSGQVNTGGGNSPDKPTGLSVNNLTNVPVKPTFSWTRNPAVGQYRLNLSGDSGNVVNTTYNAAQICTADTCTVTPEAIPAWGLVNGAYNWWVQALISSTSTPISDTQTFNVNIPAAEVPSGFRVDDGQYPPVFYWDNDPNALYFQVFVGTIAFDILHLQWHEKTADLCSDTTCSLALDNVVAQGEYYFYIQHWGPGGFSTGGINGWDGITFTLSPANPITQPTVSNPDSGQPTFSWTASEKAAYYQFWVGIVEPLQTEHTNWYTAADLACADDGTCTLTPQGLNLSSGSYSWYVQAWKPGGVSEWVEAGEFAVNR